MSMERAIFAAAHARLKAPYLWAAKGGWAVRGGARVPVAQLGADWAVDCSGLVTACILEVGGPDLRATWGSERMAADLPPPRADESLWLLCYPGHVALGLGGAAWTIEAAGGDETTLTLDDARARGACVQIGPATHRVSLLVRSLRALMTAHP